MIRSVPQHQNVSHLLPGQIINPIPSDMPGLYRGAAVTTMIAPNEGQKTKAKRNYVEDHARRTLRKAGLTPEQAANVVRALKASPRHPEIKLNALSRKIPKRFGGELHRLLVHGFGWASAEVALGLKAGYFHDLCTQHLRGL